MSLIADLSTVTSHQEGTFRLVLPDTEEEGFPSFSGVCTVTTCQNTNCTVNLPLTPKLTTFPRWQPSLLSSHSFSWCASPETLSIHRFALIPSARPRFLSDPPVCVCAGGSSHLPICTE